jgi:predicted DsbA family dithiol-disulfide isomerase
MTDMLFSEPKRLDDATLMSRAESLGLARESFGGCLSGDMPAKVTLEGNEAANWGVRTTPTFFIGTQTKEGVVKVTQRFAGALPYDRFVEELDKAIAGAK